MNKRIEEIIEECTYVITDYVDGIDNSREEFDKEKFAKMIVHECALQCLHNEDMDLIEKHFGVEE